MTMLDTFWYHGRSAWCIDEGTEDGIGVETHGLMRQSEIKKYVLYSSFTYFLLTYNFIKKVILNCRFINLYITCIRQIKYEIVLLDLALWLHCIFKAVTGIAHEKQNTINHYVNLINSWCIVKIVNNFNTQNYDFVTSLGTSN